MKVYNKTNGKLVGDKIKTANNPFTRIIGLLCKSSLDDGEGLLIVPCSGIHSFGMKFDFDAVFLSKDNEVQHVIKAMKPCRIAPFIKNTYSTLELPAGTIDKAEIRINDILEFQK